MVTWASGAQAGIHPLEEESYRVLRSRIDLSRLPKFSRDVTERVIHASADFDYATDLVCDEESLASAVAALAAGAPVIADAAMVAAAITGCPVICKTGESLTTRLARTAAITRSAAAVRLAFGEAGPGAVWVVGCAPMALQEILSRGGGGGVRDRDAGRPGRRGGGEGRAAGQRPPLAEQRVGEGRCCRGRRGLQRAAPLGSRDDRLAGGLGSRSAAARRRRHRAVKRGLPGWFPALRTVLCLAAHNCLKAGY